MKGKVVLKTVLNIVSWSLPLVLAVVNNLQMREAVAEAVEEALTPKE